MLQVTEEDLDSFQADYRGSEEEAADLLQMYARFKGNMDMVRQDTWLTIALSHHVPPFQCVNTC